MAKGSAVQSIFGQARRGRLGLLNRVQKDKDGQREAQQTSRALCLGWVGTLGSLSLGAGAQRGPTSLLLPSFCTFAGSFEAQPRCRSPGTHRLSLSLLLNPSHPGKALCTFPPIPFSLSAFCTSWERKEGQGRSRDSAQRGLSRRETFPPLESSDQKLRMC